MFFLTVIICSYSFGSIKNILTLCNQKKKKERKERRKERNGQIKHQTNEKNNSAVCPGVTVCNLNQ